MTTKRSRASQSTASSSVADHYDGLASALNHESWYQEGTLDHQIDSLIPESRRAILELGCGTGRLLSQLARRPTAQLVVGVDISREMVRVAAQQVRDQANCLALNGDWIGALDQIDTSVFDAVVVKNTIHLLSDPTQRFHELLDITSPSACVVFVETVSPSIVANQFIRKLFSLIGLSSVKHHYFTEKTLLDTINASGWFVNESLTRIQMIDVDKWLMHRCPDPDRQRAARDHLKSAPSDVRRSLRFSPRANDTTPSQMLRLQCVGRCFRKM